MAAVRHRRRRVWSIFAFSVILIYIACGFYFWMIQDTAIFKPHAAIERTPADLQPPLSYVDVQIPIENSSIHAVWLPAPARESQPPVVLYLHGQESTFGKCLDQLQCLHELGCHVLAIDYRGYGETYDNFVPSEFSVCQDAEAAWDFLVQQREFSPSQILIYGHSLGGAIAIELATRRPESGGLVVESTFTSIKEVVRWKAPLTLIYPLDWMLRHHFTSIDKVQTHPLPPTLIIHGTADTKVPCFMSETLHHHMQSPNKELLLIEGGQHVQRGNGQATYRAKLATFISEQLAITPED